MSWIEQTLFYGNLAIKENVIADDISVEMSTVADYFKDIRFDFPPNYVSYDELLELSSYLKENYYDPKTDWFIQDEDLNSYLIKKSKELGFSQKKSYNIIQDLTQELSSLILDLKRHWNRARPYQYAYFLSIEFSPFQSISSHTPSYPSGHSLLAMCWENKILSIKPELKSKTNKIVDSVNMGRMALGLHFPSDIEFSRTIANFIKSNNIRL